MPDKIKDVYDLISDKGYFANENEFRTFVSDPTKRKEAYSLISDDGFFKDENEFNSFISEPVKKKEPTAPSIPNFSTSLGGDMQPLPSGAENISQSPLQSNLKTEFPTYIDPTKPLKTKEVIDVNAEKKPFDSEVIRKEREVRLGTHREKIMSSIVKEPDLYTKKASKSHYGTIAVPEMPNIDNISKAIDYYATKLVKQGEYLSPLDKQYLVNSVAQQVKQRKDIADAAANASLRAIKGKELPLYAYTGVTNDKGEVITKGLFQESNEKIVNEQNKEVENYKINSENLTKTVAAEVAPEVNALKLDVKAKAEILNKEVETAFNKSFEEKDKAIYEQYNQLVQSGQMTPEVANNALKIKREELQKQTQAEISAAYAPKFDALNKESNLKSKDIQSAYNRNYLAKANLLKDASNKKLQEIAQKNMVNMPKGYIERWGKDFQESLAEIEKKNVNQAYLEAKRMPAEARLAKAVSFGFGNVLGSIGGAMSFAGLDASAVNDVVIKTTMENELTSSAYYRIKDEEAKANGTPHANFVEKLSDPSWWYDNMGSTAPFMLVTMPVGIAAGGGAGSLARLLGASKRATTIASVVGGGAVSWYGENTLEAGSAFNDAINQGYSEKDASEIAARTFSNNLWTLPLSVFQMMPVFSKAFNFTKALPLEILSGGAEEILQGWSQAEANAAANGFDVSLFEYAKTPQALEEGTIGGAMQAGMAMFALDETPNIEKQISALMSSISVGGERYAREVLDVMNKNKAITDAEFKEANLQIDYILNGIESVQNFNVDDNLKVGLVSKFAKIGRAKALITDDENDLASQAAKEMIAEQEKEIKEILKGNTPLYLVFQKGNPIPTVATEEQFNTILKDPKLRQEFTLQAINDDALQSKIDETYKTGVVTEEVVNAEQEIIPATEAPAAPISGVSGEVQASGNVEDSLKDVESTTKALENKTMLELKTAIGQENDVDIFSNTRPSEKMIAEEYHKAKEDGSNPELVKAIEELLTNITTKQNDKENGTGVQSNIGEGQEPIKTQPIENGGTEEVIPSGNVQTSEEEVAKANLEKKEAKERVDKFVSETIALPTTDIDFKNLLETNPKKALQQLIDFHTNAMKGQNEVTKKYSQKAIDKFKALQNDIDLLEKETTKPIEAKEEESKKTVKVTPKDGNTKVLEIKSNKDVSKAFDLVYKELGHDETAGLLYNWNESELSEDGNQIKSYVGRDSRYSTGKEGGTQKGGKKAFINWLLSDEPFNEEVYGKGIKNNEEWVSNINKARKVILNEFAKQKPIAEQEVTKKTTEVTPKEGDSVIVKSRFGRDEKLVFNKGEWKVQFGKDAFSDIGKAAQQEAQEAFNKKNASVAEVKEQAPVVKEQAAPPVKAEEKPVKEQKEPVKEQTEKEKAKEKAKEELRARAAKAKAEAISAAQKVQQALEATGITVEVLDNEKEFQDKLDAEGVNRASSAGKSGVFISKSGKIFINGSKVDANWGSVDVWHEGTHPIINIIRNTNPKLYNSIVDGLNKLVTSNPEIADVLKWAQKNYKGKNTLEDETITETIARIANGNIDISKIPTSLRDKIIDFINEIAKSLGIKPMFKSSNVATFKKIAGEISAALKEGKDISSIVGAENVKNYESKITIEDSESYIKKANESETSDGVNNENISISNINGKSERGIQFSKRKEITKEKIEDKIKAETIKAVKNSILDYKSLKGRISRTLFYDNTRVGSLEIKNRITGYTPSVMGKGGFFYSYMPSSIKNKAVLAFTSINQAIQTLKRQMLYPDGLQAIAAQNFQTAHLGNKSTLEALFGKSGSVNLGIFQDSVKENPKGEVELLETLKKATIDIANQKVQSGVNEGKPTASAEEIKKIIERNGGNLDGIKSLDDYRDKVLTFTGGDSFGARNILFTEVLQEKPTKITKSTRESHQIIHYKYGIPTLSEIAEGNNQSELNNAETGDVVKFVKPYTDPVVYTTDKKIYKQYSENPTPEMVENGIKIKLLPKNAAHESYAFVLKGENVGVLDNYISATQLYEENEKIANTPKKQSFYKVGRMPANAEAGKYPVNPIAQGKAQWSQGNRDAIANENLINGFYSNTENALGQVKQEKMSGNQWVTQLLSRGANKEEMVLTGLESYLKENAAKPVSKADIQKYLKDNRIEIEEVVKGVSKMSKSEAKKVFEDKGYDVITDRNGDTYVEKDEEAFDYNDMSEAEQNAFDVLTSNNLDRVNTSNDTKFGNRPDLQLEGEKENYKEVLVTLPQKDVYSIEETENKGNYVLKVNGGNYAFNDNVEYLKNIQTKLESGELKHLGKKFQSSHFGEANILVHLRMNTRIDSNGNKVLFLEEVQSDWGQSGKKKGFKPTFEIRNEKGMFNVYSSINNMKEPAFTFDTKEDANKMLETLSKTNESKVSTAPFVMDTNAWTKLGLKVALKEAVAQGVDKIAWTTGEQQNDRYDLSKSVNEIKYKKNSDGNYRIEIEFKNGDGQNGNVEEKELEATVGKEIAQKIIDTAKSDFQAIKEDGLKVGGKGMKGFYGSPTEGKLGIVGEVAKSLVKQEPKTVTINKGRQELNAKDFYNNIWRKEVNPESPKWEDLTDNEYNAVVLEYEDFKKREKIKDKPTTQNSIDITPELKAQVEEGLPQFSQGNRDIQSIADMITETQQKGVLDDNEIAETLENSYTKEEIQEAFDYINNPPVNEPAANETVEPSKVESEKVVNSLNTAEVEAVAKALAKEEKKGFDKTNNTERNNARNKEAEKELKDIENSANILAITQNINEIRAKLLESGNIKTIDCKWG